MRPQSRAVEILHLHSHVGPCRAFSKVHKSSAVADPLTSCIASKSICNRKVSAATSRTVANQRNKTSDVVPPAAYEFHAQYSKLSPFSLADLHSVNESKAAHIGNLQEGRKYQTMTQVSAVQSVKVSHLLLNVSCHAQYSLMSFQRSNCRL